MQLRLTSDEFIERIQKGTLVQIVDGVRQIVSAGKKTVPYAQTMISYSEPDGGAKFCIVTAPGATGKSALCNYIAQKTEGAIWNLAQATIGDSFFIGTLAACHGTVELPTVLNLLQDRKYTLILDALDEAEITSGWNNIEKMLLDINSFLPPAAHNQVVIVARNETAELISLCFEERNISCAMAEVGRFEGRQIIDFCMLHHKIQHGGVELPPRAKTILEELLSRVQTTYSEKSNLPENESSESQFIGYAPVLQVITEFISAAPNVQRILSGDTETEDIRSIHVILDKIIDREQNKFIQAFQLAVKTVQASFTSWKSLYTGSEQTTNILNLVHGSGELSEIPFQLLPAAYHTEYRTKCRSFVPQHPFLLGGLFAGPAFEEYALLAKLKNSGSECVYNLLRQRSKPLSPLLWEFYRLDRTVVDRKLFGFLLDSIFAGQRHDESICVNLYGGHQGGPIHFDILRERSGFVRTSERFELDGLDTPILLNASLVRLSVNVAADIVIDCANEVVKLNATHILCKTLRIDAKKLLVLGASSQEESVLVAEECTYSSDIHVDDKENLLSTYWKDGDVYPWAASYSEEYVYSSEESEVNWGKYLHSILGWFRKDKRNTLGKHKEMIDNIAVGSSQGKKQVLNFLKEKKIITELSTEPKYFIEPLKLDKYGIEFNATSGAVSSTGIHALYQDFLRWKFDNPYQGV